MLPIPLSPKEWFEKTRPDCQNICKFKHIFSDQDMCFECDGMPTESRNVLSCGKIKDAYDKYVKSFGEDTIEQKKKYFKTH